MVQTVLGSVPAEALGQVMMHEHVIASLVCYWSPEDDPELADAVVSPDRLGDIRSNAFACRSNLILNDLGCAVSELAHYRSAGGGTIVEVTSLGLGRDVRALAWVAERTGVHIVAGCGYYIRPSHPPGIERRSTGELAEEMLSDLEAGVGGTSIRAGIIGELGMATSPMDPIERRVLEAAARVQQQAGVGIVTHCAPGKASAFEIAGVLEAAGADMTRVVISHLDERFRTNIGLFRDLARTGVRFGFDTFGRELWFAARGRQHPSDDVRIDALCGLVDAGLLENVVLAQDICLRHEQAAFGGHGYAHVLRRIVPRLQARGVSKEQLDAMLVDNPRRVLVGTDG